MTYVVVIADRVAASGLELLEREPQIEVVMTAGQSPEHLTRAMARAHALIVRSDTHVTDELMASAPHLVVIGRAGIGVDTIDVAAATHRGIAVLNAPGANTVSAAEHAIALLLAAVRRIPAAHDSMRRGEWDRKPFAGTELRGKTLGIVGLGRIGRHVAGVARAFGMTVVAHDPFLPAERAQAIGVPLLPLDELLERSDVVTLHLPLTNETRHLIGCEQLTSMKPGALLINTARGALVDEAALLDALKNGKLGGAALDVFEPEPLAADSPLRSAERVLLTPHLAASTSEAQERVAREICVAVRDALLTGSLGDAVNLPGVSREVLVRLEPVLLLARRLGRLAMGIARGRVHQVSVGYGGQDHDAPRPTQLAALEGVLTAMGVGPVTMVNAAGLAEERGLEVRRWVGAAAEGYETTVGVTLALEDRTVEVLGAVVGQRAGRVIRLNGFEVDVPAAGHMVLLRNKDVPGVIGRVGTLLGEMQINIAAYHQSRREPGGAEALATVVVDEVPSREVLARLEQMPDVLEVRVADLGD